MSCCFPVKKTLRARCSPDSAHCITCIWDPQLTMNDVSTCPKTRVAGTRIQIMTRGCLRSLEWACYPTTDLVELVSVWISHV